MSQLNIRELCRTTVQLTIAFVMPHNLIYDKLDLENVCLLGHDAM